MEPSGDGTASIDGKDERTVASSNTTRDGGMRQGPVIAAAAAALSVLMLSLLQGWRLVTAEERPNPIFFWQVDSVIERLGAIERDLATRPVGFDGAETIAELVRLAKRDPIERRTYYLAIDVLRRSGHGDVADRLEDVVAHLSLRDAPVQVRIADRRIQSGDFGDALMRLDALARAFPDNQKAYVGFFVMMSLFPETHPLLSTLLDQNPSWGREFVSMLYETSADKASYFDFMRRHYRDKTLTVDASLRTHVDRLIRGGRPEEAFELWRRLSAQNGVEVPERLFDGGFAHGWSGLFYGWESVAVRNVDKTFVPHPTDAGRRALRVEFLGDATPDPGAHQNLRLAPGGYRLTGKVRTLDLRTEKGVGWQLACRDGQGRLAKLAATTPEKGSADWRDFRLEFTVPANDCATQQLRLEVVGPAKLDTRVSGVVFYRDLAIDPK